MAFITTSVVRGGGYLTDLRNRSSREPRQLENAKAPKGTNPRSRHNESNLMQSLVENLRVIELIQNSDGAVKAMDEELF